jgi:hypothetical protein
MVFAVSTFWQTFIILIVWIPLLLLRVLAFEHATGRGSNAHADR